MNLNTLKTKFSNQVKEKAAMRIKKTYSIRVKIPAYKMWFGNVKEEELIFCIDSSISNDQKFHFAYGRNMKEWRTKNGVEKYIKIAEEVWRKQTTSVNYPEQVILNSEIFIKTREERI